MKKPVYLLPFIYVYKFMKILFLILKYITYGIVFSSLFIYRNFGDFFRLFIYGFLVVCFGTYKWIKYIIYGFYFPFVFISNKLRIRNDKKTGEKEQKILSKEKL